MITDNLDKVMFDKKNNNPSLYLLLTCVNYADYLEDTCIYNTQIFDKIYIITTKEDIHTQKICSLYTNIVTYITNMFTMNKAIFNKGVCLNYGLSKIPENSWLVIGDADCIYPSCIRNDILQLDHNKLYSYKRHKVLNKKHLKDIINNNVEPIFLPNRNSRNILGYCQLFHKQSLFFQKNPNYPINYKSAGGCDSRFAAKWPREHKQVLQSGHVLHLGETNINWYGRKSINWQ